MREIARKSNINRAKNSIRSVEQLIRWESLLPGSERTRASIEAAAEAAVTELGTVVASVVAAAAAAAVAAAVVAEVAAAERVVGWGQLRGWWELGNRTVVARQLLVLYIREGERMRDIDEHYIT